MSEVYDTPTEEETLTLVLDTHTVVGICVTRHASALLPKRAVKPQRALQKLALFLGAHLDPEHAATLGRELAHTFDPVVLDESGPTSPGVDP